MHWECTAREVAHVLAAVGPPLPPGAIDLAAMELAYTLVNALVEHQSESNPTNSENSTAHL